MNHLQRIQDLLPGPYAVAAGAVLTDLLTVVANELETFQEDLDRMRQSHWIRFAYRLEDAEKIGALVGIPRLPWEALAMYRERLLALVVARLRGALGPGEIKRFVYDYLLRAEEVLGCLLVPGLDELTFEQTFDPPDSRPRFRPLALIENPSRMRSSATLAARSGRLPYLYRWQESNRGLDETVATFRVSGLRGHRTSVPVLVNLTTGDLLGYAGRIPFGQTVVLRPREGGSRLATATVDGADVTGRLFSMAGFRLGVPFRPEDLDAEPRLPRLARGPNDWIFLSVGLYDVRGLNAFFFSIAGEALMEGVFGQATFDRALFPSGPVAQVEMDWIETEPASFEVRVPRHLVVEPAELGQVHPQVAEALEHSLGQLHAAGVRATLALVPFLETQRQVVRVSLPWRVTDPERGPAGTADELSLGGRFGESALGGSRYE